MKYLAATIWILVIALTYFAKKWIPQDLGEYSEVISQITLGLFGLLIFNDAVTRVLEDFLSGVYKHIKKSSTNESRNRRPASFDGPQQPISVTDPNTHAGAKVWVVASGKGGVGKTVISLGLAEKLSKDRPVLLIDFDLHNRGLSSALNSTADKKTPSCFKELTRFRNLVKSSESPAIRSILTDSRPLLSQTDAHQLLSAFTNSYDSEDPAASFAKPGDYKIKFTDFSKLFSAKGPMPAKPQNIGFLASRIDGERFLFNEIASSSCSSVYYFIKGIARLAALNGLYSDIIIDCHGAHDAFNAGALLAADNLIVVATPDPGCFEGTVELLDELKRVPVNENRRGLCFILNACVRFDGSMEEAKTYYQSPSSDAGCEFIQINEIRTLAKAARNYDVSYLSTIAEFSNKLDEVLAAIDKSRARKEKPPVIGSNGSPPINSNETKV